MKPETNKLNVGKKQWIAIAVIAAVGIGLGSAILGGKTDKSAEGEGHGSHVEAKAHSDGEHHGKTGADSHEDDKGHADGEHHEGSSKGPHGGKLFKEGDFGLEALLAEDGGEPRLRIWLYEREKALASSAAKVSATVTRLTGEKQALNFTPDKDSLLSREIVPEPHAFEINIVAQTANAPFTFSFSQEEGKVELSDAQIKAASIGIDTAGAASIKSALQLPGEIRLNEDRTSHVVPRIAGVVESVQASLGQTVKKGQVLARLDDTGLRAGLAAAEAQVRTAEANLGQVRAQLAQAQADERRQAELQASGMTTRQSREQAATAVKTVSAQLEAAQRQIEAAQAQARSAKVNFDYATVRAPFDGVVTARAAQVGEIISPLSAGGGFTRTGVGTIVDMESLEVNVDVNEAYIAQVKPDMPCEAVLDAYPDWQIPAHVVAVIPSADRGKATVKVRVALEQKDDRVVPDMGVRVSFLAAKPAAAAKPASCDRSSGTSRMGARSSTTEL